MIRVKLTADEAMAASSVACLQMIRKVHNERAGDHGGRSERPMRLRWADGIHGAMAEMAVCKAFNLAPGGGKISLGEIGGVFEARATEHRSGHLLVYERDADNSWFVFVIGHFPFFDVVGAILGSEAKKPEHWHGNSDPPCYWVKQDGLIKAEDFRDMGARSFVVDRAAE